VDNFRFTAATDSTINGVRDQITGFDASADTFIFANMTGANGFTGQIDFVETGVFVGTPGSLHSEARLMGNTLEIDVDGDGLMTANDMEIQFGSLTGTLTDSNFSVIL